MAVFVGSVPVQPERDRKRKRESEKGRGKKEYIEKQDGGKITRKREVERGTQE